MFVTSILAPFAPVLKALVEDEYLHSPEESPCKAIVQADNTAEQTTGKEVTFNL